MRVGSWVGILVVLGALVGCGSCDRQSDRGETADEGEGPTEAPEEQEKEGPPVGTIEGVVRLAEGAELPEYTVDMIVEKPEIEVDRPEECPPPTEADRRPVDMGEGRTLEGVLVSAADFSASPPREPKKHEVVIRDCQLTPQLVVGMRGDEVVLRNETSYPFLPRVGGDPFMKALTQGKERAVALERGGIYPIRCGVGAPCGRTELVVIYHPVYATTGKDGRFRIDNVPAGETLTLHAWHPMFEESATEVKVAPGETERVDFVIRPSEKPGEPGGAPNGEADGAGPKDEAEQTAP